MPWCLGIGNYYYNLFPSLVNKFKFMYMNSIGFLLKLFYMPSELQEERDNARDMIEEAYQSYRSESLFINPFLTSYSLRQCCGSGSRIQCPFYPLDPVSGMGKKNQDPKPNPG